MLTLNQNVQVGDDVLHVQTEYYSSSKKVVSNILKGGIVVKRIEKDVPPDAAAEEINRLIKKLHVFVVNSIKNEYEKRNLSVKEDKVEEVRQEKPASEERVSFSLPDDIKEKLEDFAHQYVGFYAPSLVEELIESSASLPDFMEKYKEEIKSAGEENEGKVQEFLEKLFRKYLYDFDLNVEGLGFSVDFAEALNKPLLEEILVEEFGFLAPQVAGEIKEALAGAKTLDEAVGVVLSHVEEEETKKKIEEHKKKLFRI